MKNSLETYNDAKVLKASRSLSKKILSHSVFLKTLFCAAMASSYLYYFKDFRISELKESTSLTKEIKYSSIKDPIKKSIYQSFPSNPEASLAPKLAQKFNLEEIKLLKSFVHPTYRVDYSKFIPIAYINSENLILSKNGKVYKNTLKINSKFIPTLVLNPKLISSDWKHEHTLILSEELNDIIINYLKLTENLHSKKIKHLQARYFLHRGFQVTMESSVKVQLGLPPFSQSLEKYLKILNRQDINFDALVLLELDFPKKALITYKPE